jgi:glycine betaine/proline transport system permease protein
VPEVLAAVVDLKTFFEDHSIPLDKWIQDTVDWLNLHLRTVFVTIRWPVDKTLHAIDDVLRGAPVWLVLVCVFVIAWRLAGYKLGVASVASLVFIGFLGLWDPTMTTIAMIVTCVLFCVVTGIPIGILAARSDRLERAILPVLDAMQTTPTLVYLVPIVVLFGIGTVPGLIATIIVAMPPMIRLTNLGIREVQEDLVEAGHAFGATPVQLLREVQVPLALPAIMVGVNQTLMAALSMVVVIALIGAQGLGLNVYEGINQLDVGQAGVAGIAIVLLAVTFDRVTQAPVKNRRRAQRES